MIKIENPIEVLYLSMADAYQKGISTHEWRKCLTRDTAFCRQLSEEGMLKKVREANKINALRELGWN